MLVFIPSSSIDKEGKRYREIVDSLPGMKVDPPQSVAECSGLETDRRNAQALAEESHSENTLKGYSSDWQHFLEWCHSAAAEQSTIRALPASDETLALYVGHEIGTRHSTLQRRVAAIRFVHLRAGYVSPFDGAVAFMAAYKGHRRRWSGVPQKPRQLAITEPNLVRMADIWANPEDSLSVRNRALLLVGFDGALRRSELVSLNFESLEWHHEGVIFTLGPTKGDSTGKGAQVPIAARDSRYCSVDALRTWLEQSGITSGAIFRRFNRQGVRNVLSPNRLSPQSVLNLVKNSAKLAGLDGNFGAHSLRRGFINCALEADAELHSVSNHVRHKNRATTVGYLQQTKAFKAHPGARLLGEHEHKKSAD